MARINHYQKEQKFYSEAYWKDNDGNNPFRPNGFSMLPEKIYQAFAEQINKDGEVLDLGCGNGLMLKYLMQSLDRKLIPYGADFIERSVRQAKELILPQYANNFSAINVVDYSFTDGPFDFIFTFLSHIYPDDRKEYLKKIKKYCRKGGRVIFYEYADVLKNLKYDWVGDFPELKNWPLIRKDYPGVSIGVWNSI